MTGNQGKHQISISENNTCHSTKKRQKAPINLVPCHLRLSPQPSALSPMRFSQSSVLSPQSLQPKSLNFTQICTDLLRSGKLVRFRAPGYSMYPTILHEDVITVEPVEASDIRVGDIALYRKKNSLIAHRVVRIEIKNDTQNDPQSSVLSPQSCFILRGDARPVCDDPVAAEQVLGKVVLIENNGRGLDPYGIKAKLTFNVRRLVFRLKRFLNPV